jgi:hypothetical protein
MNRVPMIAVVSFFISSLYLTVGYAVNSYR